MKSYPLRRAKTAFSLVETVIAIGVVAFALIPMMSLLPIGLNTHRHTMDMTAGTRIGQLIAGEISAADAPPSADERYFDVLGQEVSSLDSMAVYFVNIVPQPSATLPGDSTSDRKLTRVVVQVCYNPARATLEREESGLVKKNEGHQIREYSFYTSR
jgi:uncharacterized protein (TIGR02598 family)